MTPREIIAKAWSLTTHERSVRRWGFATAFFETLLTAKLVAYQVWFAYSYWQGDPIGFFSIEGLLFDIFPTSVAIGIIVTFLSLLVIELFFPHMATGAVIGLTAKAYRKEPVRGGFILGLFNFFPIFVVHEFLVLNSITTVITASSLLLRYGGEGDIKYIAIGILCALWLFSVILKFFWSFAEEAVVINKIGPFAAMGRSFKLVLSYLGHLLFILVLLFVIFIRIIVNAIITLLIPAVMIGVGFLLTGFLPDTVSYSIAGILGLALIVLASYFFAYLEVFRQAVWVITYIELSNRKDLDVIEE